MPRIIPRSSGYRRCPVETGCTSEINLIRREYDHAKYHHDRALSLNPNDPRIVAQRGSVLASLGQAGDGVRWIEQAFRLDPAEPEDYCLPALVVLHTASRYGDCGV